MRSAPSVEHARRSLTSQSTRSLAQCDLRACGAGMATRFSRSQAIFRSCRCRRAHPNSTVRKTSSRPYVRCRCVCRSSTLCDQRGLRRIGRRRASPRGRAMQKNSKIFVGVETNIRIHATELALEPSLQILRRYRPSLLLRLEHAHRSALEDHVHRAPRLGERGLLNVRMY